MVAHKEKQVHITTQYGNTCIVQHTKHEQNC
jgi:hypothetical protein